MSDCGFAGLSNLHSSTCTVIGDEGDEDHVRLLLMSEVDEAGECPGVPPDAAIVLVRSFGQHYFMLRSGVGIAMPKLNDETGSEMHVLVFPISRRVRSASRTSS